MKKFQKIANDIGALVDVKNAAYGNSFDDCGQFLKLLYPEGIPTDKYSDMLCIVRIFDKLKRIATKKDALGESPYSDIVGYGLLGLEKDNRGQKQVAHLHTSLEKLTEQIEDLEALEAQARRAQEENDTSAIATTKKEILCDICHNPVDNIPEAVGAVPGQKFAHETCFNSKLATAATNTGSTDNKLEERKA